MRIKKVDDRLVCEKHKKELRLMCGDCKIDEFIQISKLPMELLLEDVKDELSKLANFKRYLKCIN